MPPERRAAPVPALPALPVTSTPRLTPAARKWPALLGPSPPGPEEWGGPTAGPTRPPSVVMGVLRPPNPQLKGRPVLEA